MASISTPQNPWDCSSTSLLSIPEHSRSPLPAFLSGAYFRQQPFSKPGLAFCNLLKAIWLPVLQALLGTRLMEVTCPFARLDPPFQNRKGHLLHKQSLDSKKLSSKYRGSPESKHPGSRGKKIKSSKSFPAT